MLVFEFSEGRGHVFFTAIFPTPHTEPCMEKNFNAQSRKERKGWKGERKKRKEGGRKIRREARREKERKEGREREGEKKETSGGDLFSTPLFVFLFFLQGSSKGWQ